MSNPFTEAKKAVRGLKEVINPVIQKTFQENDLVILDYQVNKQLFDRGEDSKGSVIRPAYKPITIKMKRKKGQPTDRVTLKDKGKLHHSIEVIAKGEEVEITTNLSYAKYLFKKYGDDVLGIQEELLTEFTNKYILPNLKRAWDDKLAES